MGQRSVTPEQHGQLVDRGFGKPYNRQKPWEFLQASGWRCERDGWYSPSGVDYGQDSAVKHQMDNDGVRFVQSFGFKALGSLRTMPDGSQDWGVVTCVLYPGRTIKERSLRFVVKCLLAGMDVPRG